MKAVIQEEVTGCAIASSAAIAGISYQEAKQVANALGIYADDSALWSEMHYIRTLLKKLGITAANKEQPFTNFQVLPDIALLSTKWHVENGKPYWHWAVFVREANYAYVLDSKKSLKSNVRTDFWCIKPKDYY